MLLKSTGHVFVLFLQFITGMLLCSIQHTAKKHKKCTEVRAGHAKTLPRQRDRIFRPQKCCLLHYYWYRTTVYSLWVLYLDNETITFLQFFLVPEDLLRCRVVAVAML